MSDTTTERWYWFSNGTEIGYGWGDEAEAEEFIADTGAHNATADGEDSDLIQWSEITEWGEVTDPDTLERLNRDVGPEGWDDAFNLRDIIAAAA
jgi:hypothetical protein